jgi:hypothetical protein
MQKARNITVAVSPEIYRQTRRLATDYDTTVTEMIKFLLLLLPEAVNAALKPGGRPQFARALYLRDQAAKTSAQTPPNSPIQPRNELQKPICIPVHPN